jgi:hypothetical protein
VTSPDLSEFAAIQAAADATKAATAEVRRENERLRSRVAALTQTIAELEQVADLASRLDAAEVRIPRWLGPPKPKGGSHATLMLLQSDQHFDEVVNPAEMDGLNAYNREIATARLERWARNVVRLARDYLAGLTYDGVVLMLGGDAFSGVIHDELRETNADVLFGSLLYWLEQEAAAVSLLCDEFGKVHVVAVPGNHGRQTRKPRAKLRARDNLDWLFAKLLEREFRSNTRVTFHVPEAADAWFQVYGRGHLLTHGDQVTGGHGIGGIWPPIMRMRARKAEVHMTTGRPFDTLWMGHWHQLIPTPGLIINGTLKGWDEYAKLNNFSPEPPQQAMAVVTPEHGIAWQAPVFCADRSAEGW